MSARAILKTLVYSALAMSVNAKIMSRSGLSPRAVRTLATAAAVRDIGNVGAREVVPLGNILTDNNNPITRVMAKGTMAATTIVNTSLSKLVKKAPALEAEPISWDMTFWQGFTAFTVNTMLELLKSMRNNPQITG